MEAQVDFNRYNYEQSIVRIWNGNNQAIGTGFLIAPGYVLTCAHVVLQAQGVVEEESYASYQKRPRKVVAIDFPLLDNTRKIDAEVVGWLPFELNGGDVAALKLMSPMPSGAVPLPIVEVSLPEIKGKEHLVYGFGNDIGDCSQTYIPKAGVMEAGFNFGSLIALIAKLFKVDTAVHLFGTLAKLVLLE